MAADDAARRSLADLLDGSKTSLEEFHNRMARAMGQRVVHIKGSQDQLWSTLQTLCNKYHAPREPSLFTMNTPIAMSIFTDESNKTHRGQTEWIFRAVESFMRVFLKGVGHESFQSLARDVLLLPSLRKEAEETTWPIRGRVHHIFVPHTDETSQNMAVLLVSQSCRMTMLWFCLDSLVSTLEVKEWETKDDLCIQFMKEVHERCHRALFHDLDHIVKWKIRAKVFSQCLATALIHMVRRGKYLGSNEPLSSVVTPLE